MDRDSALGSLIFGLAVGYFIWGNEPAYIDNLKASVSDEAHGEAWVLARTTSDTYDQVAVVHGLVDDAAGCETFRMAMERDGGDWVCVPTSAITGGKPWWEFW